MSHFNNIYNKLLSVTEENDVKTVTLLGIKIKIKTPNYYNKLLGAVKIQDSYNLSELKKAKKIIVFVVPSKTKMAGGIMSIFNFCHYSRMLQNDWLCIIATTPGELTYAENETFENSELVYRWNQLTTCCKSVENLTIHIPECLVKRFYKDLSLNDMKFLQSISRLRINIFNQNIALMPNIKHVEALYNLTKHITHSTGFSKYTTQQVCDLFKLPLYYIPSFLNLDNCIRKEFKNKKKIVLYSNDYHPLKQCIIEQLREELSDFEFIEINDLIYTEFLELIATAFFTISFGEGFDGYYIQPYYAGSIGITVYNEEFFPSEVIAKFPFVYKSYEDLRSRVAADIKIIYSAQNEYEAIVRDVYNYFADNINKSSATIGGLRDLYEGKPTFLPSK